MIKVTMKLLSLILMMFLSGCVGSQPQVAQDTKEDILVVKEKKYVYIENYKASVAQGRTIWFPESLTEDGFLYSERSLKVPPKSVTWEKEDKPFNNNKLEQFYMKKMKEQYND